MSETSENSDISELSNLEFNEEEAGKMTTYTSCRSIIEEEKTILWKIENVEEYFAQVNDNVMENPLIFEAGHWVLENGTRSPASWAFWFRKTRTEEIIWIGGYFQLCLKNTKEKVKYAKATYDLKIYDDENFEIASDDVNECKEYDGDENEGWGTEQLITEKEMIKKTKNGNRMNVLIKMKVYGEHEGLKPILQGEESSPSVSTKSMKNELMTSLKTMLNSEIGTDVEVSVPGDNGEGSFYTRKVHKGILMTRSSVFSTMFQKDSGMTEAKTGKVFIADLSPKGLEIFLHWLYTGEVLDEWYKIPKEIINAANKYDCQKLKHFCGHKYLAAVNIGNAMEMYYFAVMHNLSYAAKETMEYIHKNSKLIFTEEMIMKGRSLFLKS